MSHLKLLAETLYRLAACDRCHGSGTVTVADGGLCCLDECPECHGVGSPKLTRKHMDALKKTAAEI